LPPVSGRREEAAAAAAAAAVAAITSRAAKTAQLAGLTSASWPRKRLAWRSLSWSALT